MFPSRLKYKSGGASNSASSSRVCQRCEQTGHATYECKNPRPYKSRPTRAQAFDNPKLAKKLANTQVEIPEDFRRKGTADSILAKRSKEQEAKSGSKKRSSPSKPSVDKTSVSRKKIRRSSVSSSSSSYTSSSVTSSSSSGSSPSSRSSSSRSGTSRTWTGSDSESSSSDGSRRDGRRGRGSGGRSRGTRGESRDVILRVRSFEIEVEVEVEVGGFFLQVSIKVACLLLLFERSIQVSSIHPNRAPSV
ncbi:hypothetical protein IE53DRAFT_379965 [Violaceomyces palustris]|uniref:Uncharacterized protein n=1 Tax=Violaceomyces palustris TaxID=1673888 RepID=A0ACD0NWN0_9BASI|nr:hypothetical protein IE53DRAFT_379965 [Violaceomyces palustris]